MKTTFKSNWYGMEQAADMLNRENPRALYEWLMKLKASGLVKIGTHIKPLDPAAKRVTWLVNVEACDRL
jgi:hypothetical protein